MRDQLLHRGVLAEEVLDVVGAVLGAEVLILAVHRRGQAAQEHMVLVACEEGVPVRAPQHLDDVPARAGEQRLQLLHDLAVAAHRAVQALQVAVDDEAEVVQLLARGQRQAGDRLGLVHLAVAEHAPDMAVRGLHEAAVLEVAHEARLVDRAQRPEAHRAGGELPEVRHQPRMRVGAQARAAELLAIVGQLLFAQAAFEKGARVNPGRRMRLEVHEVGVARCVGRRVVAAEEVVEAHLEDLGR